MTERWGRQAAENIQLPKNQERPSLLDTEPSPGDDPRETIAGASVLSGSSGDSGDSLQASSRATGLTLRLYGFPLPGQGSTAVLLLDPCIPLESPRTLVGLSVPRYASAAGVSCPTFLASLPRVVLHLRETVRATTIEAHWPVRPVYPCTSMHEYPPAQ